uniref:Uncharacterized protein n=1 Tax=Lygus hesperus TaxID=30085 RepID=A0A146MEB0_LYGHE
MTVKSGRPNEVEENLKLMCGTSFLLVWFRAFILLLLFVFLVVDTVTTTAVLIVLQDSQAQLLKCSTGVDILGFLVWRGLLSTASTIATIAIHNNSQMRYPMRYNKITAQTRT